MHSEEVFVRVLISALVKPHCCNIYGKTIFDNTLTFFPSEHSFHAYLRWPWTSGASQHSDSGVSADETVTPTGLSVMNGRLYPTLQCIRGRYRRLMQLKIECETIFDIFGFFSQFI